MLKPILTSALVGLSLIATTNSATAEFFGGSSLQTGISCEAANGEDIKYTRKGIAVNNNFQSVFALCPIEQGTLAFAMYGAGSMTATVKDFGESPVTCAIKQYAADGSTGSVLGSATSDGSGTVQSLEISINMNQVQPDRSTILDCTLPGHGQVISYGITGLELMF